MMRFLAIALVLASFCYAEFPTPMELQQEHIKVIMLMKDNSLLSGKFSFATTLTREKKGDLIQDSLSCASVCQTNDAISYYCQKQGKALYAVSSIKMAQGAATLENVYKILQGERGQGQIVVTIVLYGKRSTGEKYSLEIAKPMGCPELATIEQVVKQYEKDCLYFRTDRQDYMKRIVELNASVYDAILGEAVNLEKLEFGEVQSNIPDDHRMVWTRCTGKLSNYPYIMAVQGVSTQQDCFTKAFKCRSDCIQATWWTPGIYVNSNAYVICH